MQWEANLIHALQSCESNFLDAIVSIITYMGDEIFFIAVAVSFFWCISKKDAFKFINIYLVGCAVVEFIKIGVGRARPYDAYSKDGYIVSISEPTGGYSFPSGHTHSIANMSTQLFLRYKKSHFKLALSLAITAVTLVAFSRIYLGQHYLTDVVVGAVCGVAIVLAGNYLFSFLKDREELIAVGVIPICIIATIFFGIFESDMESLEMIWKVTGVYLAIVVGYYIEKKYVNFSTKASAIQHIIKIIIGLAVTLLLQQGLKLIIDAELCLFVYSFVRYFLVGAWAILGAPFVFKLAKLYKVEQTIEIE